MIAVALEHVHGAPLQQREVLGMSRLLRPAASVEAVAEQHAVPVAGVQESVRRVGDVLEVDQVHVRIGEVANLVLDPPRVPIEQQLRLDVTAAAEDLLAVDQHPPAVPAVQRVHLGW